MPVGGQTIDGFRSGERGHDQRRHFYTAVRIEASGQIHPLVDEGAEPSFVAHAIAGTRSADDTGFRWSKQAHHAQWIQV